MKTLRFIGMAIIAVIMSVNFAACSSDDDDENKSDSPLVGTWMMTKSIKDGHTRIPGQNGFDSGLGLVFSANGTFYNLVENEKAEDGNTYNVELKGDDMGILIGKRGQTLDSLQYLANLAVNKNSEEYIKVKIDTEDYRKRRKETLENLAKNIAYKVKRTKRPVSLEPMNPFERRIIHSALQNDRYVTTHSEGDEPYRHVVVTLKK